MGHDPSKLNVKIFFNKDLLNYTEKKIRLRQADIFFRETFMLKYLESDYK